MGKELEKLERSWRTFCRRPEPSGAPPGQVLALSPAVSPQHLTTLLASSDMQVVLAVLNLLYVFSKRSNYITRLGSDKRGPLLGRLQHLAEVGPPPCPAPRPRCHPPVTRGQWWVTRGVCSPAELGREGERLRAGRVLPGPSHDGEWWHGTSAVAPAVSRDLLSPPWWPPVGTSVGFGGPVICCPTVRSPGTILGPSLAPSWCPQQCHVTSCQPHGVPSVVT